MSRLLQCKACGKDVSSEAKACPACGQPTPTEKTVAWLAPLASLLLAVAAYLYLAHSCEQIVRP